MKDNKTKQNTETTASLASAKEISIEAVVVAVLAELDGIFALKEEPKMSLVVFLDIFFFFLLYSQVYIQVSLPHAGGLMWPQSAKPKKPQHMEDTYVTLHRFQNISRCPLYSEVLAPPLGLASA